MEERERVEVMDAIFERCVYVLSDDEDDGGEVKLWWLLNI